MKFAPFTLMNGYLYKLGLDDVLHLYVAERQKKWIIDEAHAWST